VLVKAVFLDWFNTLARFEPSRQELYGRAFKECGIELPPREIMRGILTADLYYFEENAKSPVEKRSPEEQAKVYIHYPQAILTEAGIEVSQELPLKIIKIVFQQFKGVTFVLFDDVLSTLKTLKQQNFILGLLTNMKEVNSICRRLGLEPYLDFVASSGEIGVDKPDPRFFLAALKQAALEPQEAVHVGDQYKIDIEGARRVGITPILIDRYDLYPEVSDCPRIHSLTEVAQYL